MTEPAAGNIHSLKNTYDSFKSLGPTVPAWVANLQDQGFEKFSRIGLPSRRDEEWKYTSLKYLEKYDYSWLPSNVGSVDPKPWLKGIPKDATVLVFIDGHLRSHLGRQEAPSDQSQIVVSTLDADWQANQAVVERLIKRRFNLDTMFIDLNQAFLGAGALIRVAARTKVPPIHIVNLSTGRAKAGSGQVRSGQSGSGQSGSGQSGSGQVRSGQVRSGQLTPRHVIMLEDGAEATIVEHCASLPGARLGDGDRPVAERTGTERTDTEQAADKRPVVLANEVVDIEVGASAKLRHLQIQRRHDRDIFVGSTRVCVGAGAQYSHFHYHQGARLARYGIDVILDGEGAAAKLDALYLVRGKQHVDYHTSIDHRRPATVSSQLYKGVLDDQARGVFNGRVLVRSEAQKTDAKQLNRNLLMSPGAEIDTKPELQIDADDVKCAHGAAIGRLDEEQIFYLQSRGLSAGGGAVKC